MIDGRAPFHPKPLQCRSPLSSSVPSSSLLNRIMPGSCMPEGDVLSRVRFVGIAMF